MSLSRRRKKNKTATATEGFTNIRTPNSIQLSGTADPVELRKIAKEIGVTSISARRKDDLIVDILKTQAETMGYRFNGGTLECLPEGYGFLRPSGLLPSSNDIYVSASQIRRFGLRNGDVVWGIIRPPKEQEHYEALLRVENVNFTDPEAARKRPQFESTHTNFPDEKLNLETDRKIISTRMVDLFAPIGKGQRALIVSRLKQERRLCSKTLPMRSRPTILKLSLWYSL
jgi:transcription termination factor Rho